MDFGSVSLRRNFCWEWKSIFYMCRMSRGYKRWNLPIEKLEILVVYNASNASQFVNYWDVFLNCVEHSSDIQYCEGIRNVCYSAYFFVHVALLDANVSQNFMRISPLKHMICLLIWEHSIDTGNNIMILLKPLCIISVD